MGPEFSVPPAILAVMERWARLQPLAALPVDLHGVEAVWKRLDLAGLYLSYLGGIQLSPEDVGWPAPYAAVESYDLADGSRQLTRDPGDALWAEVFDLLPGAQESTGLKVLSADRKGDCLELTLGAAAALLDVDPREGKAGPPASQELLQCLHCARLLLEDLARTSEELRLWGPGKSQLGAAGGWRGSPRVEELPEVRGRRLWPLEVRDLDGSRERAVRPLLRLGAARSLRAACFGPQDVELAPQLIRPRKFAGDATSPTLRPGDASAKKKDVLRLRLDFRAAAVGGVSSTPDHGRRRAVRRKSSWHLVACSAGATLRQDLSIDTVKDLRPSRRREG